MYALRGMVSVFSTRFTDSDETGGKGGGRSDEQTDRQRQGQRDVCSLMVYCAYFLLGCDRNPANICEVFYNYDSVLAYHWGL